MNILRIRDLEKETVYEYYQDKIVSIVRGRENFAGNKQFIDIQTLDQRSTRFYISKIKIEESDHLITI